MNPHEQAARAPATDGAVALEQASLPEHPPLFELAWQTFQRELPVLLRDFAGQWVGYHGSVRVKVAADEWDVRDALAQLGLAPRDRIVYRIDPDSLHPIEISVPYSTGAVQTGDTPKLPESTDAGGSVNPHRKPAKDPPPGGVAAPAPASLPDHPPLYELAWEAFQRELPALLRDFAGQWVGYHGSMRVKVDPDEWAVRDALRDLGLAPKDRIVYRIDPDSLHPIEISVPSLR